VLYLFLFFVARAGWRALRPPAPPGPERVPVRELMIIDPARSRLLRGERILIRPGASVGREAGNTVIVDEDTVSASHARFSYERGRWWLEDLGSTNGTFVNRQQLNGRRPLEDGDEVQFGRVAMRFGPRDAGSGAG
jgi:pSer/pThr/pTyr-binding forkhead associated (FHA) protein